MNSKMTNEAILATEGVKEAIESGKVVIIDKIPTSKPGYINLYFIGKVEGLSGASAEVSEASAMFLNYSTSFNQRCIQNSAKEIADKYEIGQALDGFALRIKDSLKPSYKTQSARANKAGEILYHEGKEVYRNVILVTKDELVRKPHFTLEVSTSAVKAEAPIGVSANNVLEQAAK